MNRKVALVTGAAQGIGAAIARHLAVAGYNAVVNDLPQKADELRELSHEIESMFLTVDVSNRDAVEQMIASIVNAHGRLDCVVANAAWSERSPVLAMPWVTAIRTFEITQYGVFHVCQIAARQMKRGSKIVIITSNCAEIPLRNNVAYNMAKAAVTQFGRTLALELAKAVTFLASDAADYITGSVLVVDGGSSLRSGGRT